MSSFYIEKSPIKLDEKSKKILNIENCKLINAYIDKISSLPQWNKEEIEQNIKEFCTSNKINLGKLAQPLRAALTGKSVSPGLYEVILSLGKEEVIKRIKVFK